MTPSKKRSYPDAEAQPEVQKIHHHATAQGKRKAFEKIIEKKKKKKNTNTNTIKLKSRIGNCEYG